MEFKSFKTVQINEGVALAVNESENKVQIMTAASGPFGRTEEVVLSFDEFQQIVNAMQLLAIERTVLKKPKKKKEEE